MELIKREAKNRQECDVPGIGKNPKISLIAVEAAGFKIGGKVAACNPKFMIISFCFWYA